MIPIKTFDELTIESRELLRQAGFIETSAGSVVRNLLDIFNRQLSVYYKTLDITVAMCFLSSAENQYLDLLGDLLSCNRYFQETDDNYRYRISQQVFTAARSNETSLKLACLSVPYVKNIIMTPYVAGHGSFAIHVIANELDTPDSVITAVTDVVNNYKAEGIKAVVAKPSLAPIDFAFGIIPKNNISVTEDDLAIEIKSILQETLDNVTMGGIIDIYDLIKQVSQLSEVAHAYVNSILIDNNAVVATQSHKLPWDTRPYINNVTVTLMEA